MTKRIGLICGLGIVTFCASCDESSQVGFEMSSAYAESQQALSYQPEKIDSSLARYLDVPCGQEMVDISLSFDNKIDVPELEFDFEYREGKSFLNGKEATESELKKLGEELDANQDLKLAAFHDKRIRLSKNVQAKNVYKGNEESFRIFEDGFEALTISVDACVIKSLTDLEELISISETLTVEPATIATAMQATYVTQSMNWTYNHGGQDVGVYLSEPVCPPTSYLNNTNYTILSGTPVSGYTDEHARKTTRVIRDVSPNAHIYCRAGMTAPLQSDLGTAHSPRISVASLSYGSGTSTYSYTDQTLDDLVYGNYVTAVVAAGNTNNCSTTPHVASPGKAVNAITVGNYNDYSYTPSQYEINSSSCYINPTDTRSTKPELSAPGTNITGATDSNGNSYSPYSGTSFSTPHVAGMLTNFATRWSDPINAYQAFRASLFKLRTLMGATDPVKGGFSKVGIGGADYYYMYNYYMFWAIIASSYDSYVSSTPSHAQNGVMMTTRTYSASTTSKGKVGITWLVRGSYIANHKSDPYPIGSSYALSVLDPNGDVVATGWNPYDNYVILEFDHVIAGEYTFLVHKIAERDSSSTLKMFMSIQ